MKYNFKIKMKIYDVLGLLTQMNGFSEPTREIRKKLDALEESLKNTLPIQDHFTESDYNTEVEAPETNIFSIEEFESMTVASALNRGIRKAL